MTAHPLTYPLTVYFDGSCKLCSSEIEHLHARNRLAALQSNIASRELILIDCSPADFDGATQPPLPIKRTAMMSLIHACDARGQWLNGVDVFIAMYAAANLGWVSRMLAHRWIKPYAARIYPWIVRNRHLLAASGLHRLFNFLSQRVQQKAHAASATHALAQSRICALARDNQATNCTAAAVNAPRVTTESRR